jgi:hypothetical protein
MELSDARQRLRHRLEDESVSDAKVNAYLNSAAQELGRSFDWPWLLREFQFSLDEPQTQTGATFTQGSRIVTLTGALDATPFGHTLIANDRVFRVTNVENPATKVHLESLWPDATGAHDIVVTNDELCLPRGARSVQQVLLHDGSSVPTLLDSINPRDTRRQDQNTQGAPLTFSTYRRSILPQPIAAPTGATSGGSLSGVYKYWQSYWDPNSNAESRLSPVRTVTLSSNTYTLTPEIRQDLAVRWYRSVAGGSTPRFLREQLSPSDTFADAVADSYLGDPISDDASQLVLRFWPVPDGVYQVSVRATVTPPVLADDTDVFPVPEEDVGVWLTGAEAVALRATKEYQAAERTHARFLDGIRRMKNQHQPNRTGHISLSRDRGFRLRRERPIIITSSS